mgnify:CR=1 FL=1
MTIDTNIHSRYTTLERTLVSFGSRVFLYHLGDNAVMVNGNDATVKRLMKYADGIRLIPNNPAYEPIYFTNEEIIKNPVKIIGKVIENRQKY